MNSDELIYKFHNEILSREFIELNDLTSEFIK